MRIVLCLTLILVIAYCQGKKVTVDRNTKVTVSDELSGYILYIGYTGDYDVTLSAYDLESQNETILYQFGTEYQSFFLECTTTNYQNMFWVSLQYVQNQSNAALFGFDLDTKTITFTVSETVYCEAMWYDPDLGNGLICLEEVPYKWTMCQHFISLTDGSLTTFGCYPVNYIPLNECHAYDSVNKIQYSVLTGHNVVGTYIYSMTIPTGTVNTISYPFLSMIIFNLNYDVTTQNMYAVLGIVNTDTDMPLTQFLATMDMETGAYTRVGNYTIMYTQITPITSLAAPIRTLFNTMLIYKDGNFYLYLVGVDLDTGVINFSESVENPFTDIEYFTGL